MGGSMGVAVGAALVARVRAAIADRLPHLSSPEALHDHLAGLASGRRLCTARPTALRARGEYRARLWTHWAFVCTILLLTVTALTLRTAPDHDEPPVPPGAPVQGVPPRAAPGPLSDKERSLRKKLKAETANGPEKLSPEPR
jgi:hypothetical protein